VIQIRLYGFCEKARTLSRQFPAITKARGRMETIKTRGIVSILKQHPEPVGNSFDPNHHEKSLRVDRSGSSNDKLLPRVESAAAAAC
jgi:hypothetical protein